VALELLALVMFVVMVAAGVVLAPWQRSRRVLRVGAMGVAYIVVELSTLVTLGVVWLARRAYPDEWWEDTNRRLVAWALGAMLGAGRRCVGFVLAVEEPPERRPLEGCGPVLVLARHGGLGDSFAVVWMLADSYRRIPRVVLKDVLQWEPLLDVALNRLGACFISTARADGEDPAQRIGRLAAGLAERDALLLFPEGANWTPRRRRRAIDRLRDAGQHKAADAATLMENVLAPRPAGVLACLDARPDLAIAVVAHTGLDTLTTARQAWKAVPFVRPMSLRWWPAPPPPSDEAGRLSWLGAEWAVVDEWIDMRRESVAKDRSG
jgi:1-acyl-sn-glycerol-3-phosphate acyltransferase